MVRVHEPQSPHRGSLRQEDFRAYLRTLISDPDAIDEVSFCGDCGRPEWDDELTGTGTGQNICESCRDSRWSSCDSCEELYPAGSMTNTLNDCVICDACLNDHYSWCDNCDGYYHDNDDEHNHDNDDEDDYCGCEPPQPEFTIRNDGCEPLAQDTRVTVTLPAGTISAVGLDAIRQLLVTESISGGHYDGCTDLACDLESLGSEWQTKAGNFAKRLSRHAYQRYQIKLTPDVLSSVGTIARDHSNAVSVQIEVTRDLNQSAGYFYHEDSCWWGSYGSSRCAFKTNGGFGLRSFDGDSQHSISGRAWVMPLRRNGVSPSSHTLIPTFDTVTPDAFVVFNGYGDLSGYAAPRILAHMAGWTYRKIGFECSPMYVNAGGYLVAPEDIAEKYTDGSLHLSVSQHAHLFENERALANA